MLPPLIGGLHGGDHQWAGSFPRDPVLPPLIGGLHCGSRQLGAHLRAERLVLPPLIGGLHCGLLGPGLLLAEAQL